MNRMTSHNNQKLTIPLMGGLGNQLFQYAAGVNSQVYSSKKPEFLVSNKKVFNNTQRKFMLGDLINKDEVMYLGRLKFILLILLTKIKASVWIQEKNEGDFPLERVTGRTRILVGYFQKRIYVEPVASEILNAMSNSSLFKKVVSTPTKNDIAVHIRLGDYVSEPAAKRSHGLSNIEYFVRAVALLQAKHDYNKVVIYSDDSQAAYTEFVNAFGRSKIPIIISSGTNEYEDLAGISSSKGIVISNSTFSWWAAWIGTHLHDCVVIAPRPWFSKPSKADDHLLLDSWIVIDREIQR